MSEYHNNEAALFEHINNALVGELPSFGIAKESKFQQLMQRNQSQEVVQHSSHPELLNYNPYDTSLSVQAKSFQPSSADQYVMNPVMSDSINAFSNIDLNAPSDTNMARLPLIATQPNPSATEFIPRNMSAPNFNQTQQNGGFNIPEFIPNLSANRMTAVQQQTPFMPMIQQNHPYSMQQNLVGGPDGQRLSQNLQTNSPSSQIVNLPPGTHMSSPMIDSRLSGSSVFVPSPSQDESSGYYTGDSSASMTAASHGFSTPGTASPYSHPTLDSLSTSQATPERTSPLLNRRLVNQRGSPLLSQMSTGSGLNLNISHADTMHMPPPGTQENRGTTYFFTQKSAGQPLPAVMPSYQVYLGTPPNIEYMTLKSNAPSFFLPDELREAILHKQLLTMLTVDTEQDPRIPAEVDSYHSLFPLEPLPENVLQKSNTFGFVTSCYKAIKYKDGLAYCLRRIHGFRQVNEKCLVLVEMWKKLQHPNIVQLREVFTSKAFGEHSLIFAHDYHAGAETLMKRHFQTPNNFASKTKWNGGTTRQNAGLLAESLIWTYVVQLTSALRSIHLAGLACRVIDPTKIIITDKSRIRINGVGIFDVLRYDDSHENPRAHMQQYQQEDMVSLGKVVLALACNSASSFQPESFHKSMDIVLKHYSDDLKNLLFYLLSPQQRPLTVNDVMPMIGARFYTHLDNAILKCDVIENQLAKEVENGRLFRMLCKLGVINERPEFGMEPAWSETGDCYLLKLFRDHLFHQVTETGAPWIDLAHIVQCLNKLDAGVPEKVCLMSRDEQNVLVLSYGELKKAFSKCFNELLNTTSA